MIICLGSSSSIGLKTLNRFLFELLLIFQGKKGSNFDLSISVMENQSQYSAIDKC